MVSERPKLPSDIIELLSNVPGKGSPVGTVYAPQVKQHLTGFPYYRQSKGFHFLGAVDRAHVGDLALEVSKTVGERYSVPTLRVLYDSVFLDPNTIEDPVLKEVAQYCWAHAREGISGRKVFSDPSVRYVDDEYRLSGKSTEVEVNKMDAVGALELAKLFKEDKKRKVSRGRIWTDPASFRAGWGSGEGACLAGADAPGDRSDDGVAILMRTDEVQERNVVEVDADELEELKKKASDGEGWRAKYNAAKKDFNALAQRHF